MVLKIIFKVIKTKLFSKLDRFEQNGGNLNVSKLEFSWYNFLLRPFLGIR